MSELITRDWNSPVNIIYVWNDKTHTILYHAWNCDQLTRSWEAFDKQTEPPSETEPIWPAVDIKLGKYARFGPISRLRPLSVYGKALYCNCRSCQPTTWPAPYRNEITYLMNSSVVAAARVRLCRRLNYACVAVICCDGNEFISVLMGRRREFKAAAFAAPVNCFGSMPRRTTFSSGTVDFLILI